MKPSDGFLLFFGILTHLRARHRGKHRFRHHHHLPYCVYHDVRRRHSSAISPLSAARRRPSSARSQLFFPKFAYAMDRVHGWLDPFNPSEGVDTWQTVQSLYAIGSGMSRVGIGQSRRAIQDPEPQNDFAVVRGARLHRCAYRHYPVCAFFHLARRYISRCIARDRFLAPCAGAYITFSSAFRLSSTSALLQTPSRTTPHQLAFFSYGGTALHHASFAEMGAVVGLAAFQYRKM